MRKARQIPNDRLLSPLIVLVVRERSTQMYMICIGNEFGVWVAHPPQGPPRAKIGANRRGVWLTVEKRDKRIVLYLTESEHQERGPA